jgi:thiol-disulfide isomerase/thioredoxin
MTLSATVRDGFLIFAKKECPTCNLVRPVVRELAQRAGSVVVFAQDDRSFMDELAVEDDTSLMQSFMHGIEAVPTLIRFADGREVDRTVGWSRQEWERVTGISGLGQSLPPFQPGCGSKSREPGVFERLMARYGDTGLHSRRIEVGEWADPMEAGFERGWSDGLPVVPPTDERILRMLSGTTREAQDIVGQIPPNLSPCTVEKVAINAVMAGCKPEYMPVVLGALEAALEPIATLHGVLCTTCSGSPILIVNGPIARAIGMNSGINALGQGNRANATIGRALQLIVRNVGGGRPGELARSTLGGPHKYTFCFAEDESDPEWQPLAAARGFSRGTNAITFFQGDGIQAFVDQRSRTAPELCRSLALALLAVCHPKLCEFTNALLVLSPEHYGIFRDGRWDRGRIESELHKAMIRPGKDLIQGARGIGEGIDPSRANEMVNKFWPEGLLIVRAGGKAGLFSAICGGWTGGRFRDQSRPVTKEINS